MILQWSVRPSLEFCLRIRRLRLWPLLPITGLAGDMEAIQEVLSPSQWEQFQNPVAIELDAGVFVRELPVDKDRFLVSTEHV